MSLRSVFAALDRMRSEGVITFYLDPVATVDVDVFVSVVEGEYLMIGGWPIQFLPAAGPLLEEAIRQARDFDVEGVAVPVFSAEHLAAIALETGRAKDKARLVQFVEAGVLDSPRLEEILSRHGLAEAWSRFERRFIDDL